MGGGGGSQPKNGWDHFYEGSRSLKTPGKDFNLAILRGLRWMKWLKMDRQKFIFHPVIPALHPFWWKFCWLG